jgi:hypothetical protein
MANDIESSWQGKGVTDYHDFTHKNMATDDRRRLDVGDIWINAAQCLKCKEVIRSRNRHNYTCCSCGSVCVDGGSWYARRITKPKAKWKDYIVPFRYIKKQKYS